MIIIWGQYGFCKRVLAYQYDYCLKCDTQRIVELQRTFNALHLYFIPLLPLGFRMHWHCSVCNADPHTHTRSSSGFRLMAAMAFGLFTAVAWLAPVDGPKEYVTFAWGFRAAMTAAFLGSLAWYRFGAPRQNLEAHLLQLRPRVTSLCLYCGGRLDEAGFCAPCRVHRLLPSEEKTDQTCGHSD